MELSGGISRLHFLYGLMKMGIERLPCRFDRLEHPPFSASHAMRRVDHLDAFHVILAAGVGLQRALEIVNDRKKFADHLAPGILHKLRPLALGTAPEVIKLGLTSLEQILQFGLLLDETISLGGQGG